MVEWAEHAIWWQIYPLGFVAAEPTALPPSAPVIHRLERIERWLDYAVELGCSGLALGPIFAAETHGYDTLDHFRIDPRLGDDADFDRLAKAAHERGLRILLDGVFNHVGRGFPGFAEAVAAAPDSPEASWFRIRAIESGVPAYDVFEGHERLVVLNHDQPEVADHVRRVMAHWLERGADGWRLDAAYAVPAAFWRSVLPPVRSAYPQAWFVGELLHGDYSAYVEQSGLNSATQYELWKAIWSSLNDRNFFELAWALDRHNGYTEGFLPLTFVGNHDVTRLATALDDDRHVGHALAVLFSVAGTPSIYYGDEQAFRGEKEHRVGGDDAIRPEFPDSAADLAPWGWPAYRTHQRLIGFRRRHPWLATARVRVTQLANRSVALVADPPSGPGPVVTLLNVDDQHHRFDEYDAVLEVVVDSDPGAVGTDPLTVPPHSWRILAPATH